MTKSKNETPGRHARGFSERGGTTKSATAFVG